MSISIEAYDRRYLEPITALYNRETASEPHIAPLDPERFVALVERKSAFDPAGLLVAVAGGAVVGWVHACVAAGSEPGHDPARPVPRIRMLIFSPSQLKVGNALVAAATDWLKQAAEKSGNAAADAPPACLAIEAMHASAGYPFYRGLWLGGEPMGPASLPHLQLAFAVGSYRNTHESVFMVARLTAPPREPEAAVPFNWLEAAVPMAHAPMRESWTGFEPQRIVAMVNDEEAGQIGWVLLPHVAERLGAPCLNIWSLSVREPHRRRGIAAALVGRALARGYTLGARSASLGTQLWNAPAHATYAKFGFEPYCVLVGRTLELAAPASPPPR